MPESCAPQNLSIEKKSTIPEKGLGIEFISATTINEQYEPVISASMDEVINTFNNEKHHFKIHKKAPGEENTLIFTIYKSKFCTPGDVTAGYVLSSIGLLVSPVLILSHQRTSFFWHSGIFPQIRWS